MVLQTGPPEQADRLLLPKLVQTAAAREKEMTTPNPYSTGQVMLGPDDPRRIDAALPRSKAGRRQLLRITGIVFGTLAFALFAVATQAQEHSHHSHPPRDAEVHEMFYVTWNVPNNGQPRERSCCNKHDCYPTQIKEVGSTYFALRREDQRWVPIPHSKIEHNQPDPRESPDGRNHVCMAPPQDGIKVYCAVLGSGG
jgi:hypothetical protein